ncbi:hypothetical protein [Nonomuraea aridisoli]|uniref:ANTAR domain-containing protein n=1 Tax=Nonomuraea aridisoli TaxID=2070368 RepID=A0A2W2EX83_9ACTN|nr:hypothetical protein [Nonomuraea aridisoli]PZG08914.1 hypothetical protein C1J01_38375 [Nonomuraea aridisoli]
MNDESDRRRQLAELAVALLGTYTLIRRLLALLPIPINLPSAEGELFDGETFDADVALEGIERARALITDLPLDHLTVNMIGTLLLEWGTARDLLLMAEIVGPDQHRLDAIKFALMRLAHLASAVEEELDPGT